MHLSRSICGAIHLLRCCNWIAMIVVMSTAVCGCTAPAPTARVFDRVMLPDVTGAPHQPLRTASGDPVAIIFITTDCPIANAYAPEINAIVRDYQPRGVSFYLVHADRTVMPWDAQKHAQDFSYECPVLLDPQHDLVKALGATVTPEAAVINARRELVYRGRIDDQYVDFGKKRLKPSRRDLRQALDAVLAGRSVDVPRTQAIGCFILAE